MVIGRADVTLIGGHSSDVAVSILPHASTFDGRRLLPGSTPVIMPPVPSEVRMVRHAGGGRGAPPAEGGGRVRRSARAALMQTAGRTR